MTHDRNGQTPASRRALLPLTQRAYRRLCRLVQGHFGIHLSKEKQFLVVNRLHTQVLALGFTCYEAFLDHVEADASGAALDLLAGLISTNHTYFFREHAHFDFLQTHALPAIESRLAAGDNDLRVWCAAASTGEEAYSILMTMLDYFGPRYGLFNAGLLATDLSLEALREAAAGTYTAEQVQRVPVNLRQRCFRRCGPGHYAVLPEVRAEVVFRKFNLTTPRYPFKKPFHVIFCRNVMIYFDAATRRSLVESLYRFTAPGGYLFVGHAETVAADSGYRFVRPAVYQRPGQG
jgi:chemotaxis protein methyltransferase CheR